MKKYRVKVKKPWIGYPGSTIQQNYGEELDHGYFLWDISDKNDFNVTFSKIENPSPFYTIPWRGDLHSFYVETSKIKNTSRVRIHSKKKLTQVEIKEITDHLKTKYKVSEITFKVDDATTHEYVSTEDAKFLKQDLRNHEVLLSLLKVYHKDKKVSSQEWAKIEDFLKKYVNLYNSSNTQIGYKWTVKELEFDNLFSYGEKNYINFEKFNGLVGILGANRSGKSSIVGTLLYSLFNTSDRGVVKNLNIVNNRKNYCLSKVKINVKGEDYLVERQTVKQENKKGDANGITHVNFSKLSGDLQVDLNGEQRNDTEKVIRSLIGSIDDFSLSSISTQGSLLKFIDEGSSQRKALVSKFLDLDIFESILELIKEDFSEIKVKAKIAASRDLNKEIQEHEEKRETLKFLDKSLHKELSHHESNLENLTSMLASYNVSTDENKLKSDIKFTEDKIKDLKISISRIKQDLLDRKEKLDKINSIKEKYDITSLKKKKENFQKLELQYSNAKSDYDKVALSLSQKEKSVLKLLEVPCEDKFPSCKYIKDSHSDKSEIPALKLKVSELSNSLEKTKVLLESILDEELDSRIQKIENILQHELVLKEHKNKLESELSSTETNLEIYNSRLNELLAKAKSTLDDSKDEIIKQLQDEINLEKFQKKEVDKKRLNVITEIGAIEIQIKNAIDLKKENDKVLSESKIFELLIDGFSKKGIPHLIFSSQLPIINDELQRIMSGITDFSVSIECSKDSNAMEILIDYGDGKRLIESCSGMEKTISSIAIRSALSNVSVLPKSDFLILDEGFGTLDSVQVETCNKLLQSLKKYYRCIFVITHVDSMKDIMDQTIEITKKGTDSYVNFE